MKRPGRRSRSFKSFDTTDKLEANAKGGIGTDDDAATNREGIIENEAFEQLRTFAKACIALISEVRKEAYEEGEKERKKLEEEKKKLEQKKY